MKKKQIRSMLLVMIAVAMMMCAVGSTMAWLQDKTDPVVNTFTPSTVKVHLAETDATKPEGSTEYSKSFKMIPGWTITKDPKAWVEAGSEDCYLFVKIEKANDVDKYLEYSIASPWAPVDGVINVYYIKFGGGGAGVKGTEYPILTDNKVTVKQNITESDMEALTDETKYPKLTFTAYGVQLMENNNDEFEPEKAWELASQN